MPTLDDLFPPADLKAEIEGGYVARKQHPSLPLSLYVYTERCQYEPHWTPATLRCRGLIADDQTGRIVAWCLPKFFNHNQHDAGHDWAPLLPDETFEVYNKVDGSLGIVFHYDGAWHVATKGSFVSDQAAWAQAWLDNAGPGGLLDPGCTYLTEIVYPKNRIVVNHGSERTLVLLAVYGPDGVERRLEDHAEDWRSLGGRVVRSWPALPLAELVRMAEENRGIDGVPVGGTEAEGWVLRYSSGLRVKIKNSDYLHLHRALTCTSERTVWEVLESGQDPAVLYDRVPDEFADWVRKVVDRLTADVADYITAAWTEFSNIGYIADRKAFAEQAVKSDRRAALFRLYDGKGIEDLAWKSCKPRGDTPYVVDEEG